jgi:hypothetical protein
MSATTTVVRGPIPPKQGDSLKVAPRNFLRFSETIRRKMPAGTPAVQKQKGPEAQRASGPTNSI